VAKDNHLYGRLELVKARPDGVAVAAVARHLGLGRARKLHRAPRNRLPISGEECNR
jgi:hypothetical protein